jgi:DNA gyrase subunit A
MRLSSLAKLEKVELEKEAEELKKTIEDLKNILASEERQKDILKSRLGNLVKKYGDARRTELTNIEVKPEEKEIEEVVPEDCVVIFTRTVDIKRVPANSFKVQRKNGKGVKSKEDIVMSMISTNTIDNLLLFTKKGKMFKILVDELPVGTNASKGVNVNTLVNMEPDDEVIAITSLARSNTAKYVVFFTKQGLMKKTLLDEYTKIKRSTGIAAIKINEGDSIANVEFVNEENILVITKNGMSIHFESKNVNPVGRIAAGVKTIKLDESDEVLVGLPIRSDNDVIGIFSTKGYGKKTSIKEFTVQGRGGKGLIIYKPTPVFGYIAGATVVTDKDTLFLAGQPNSICIAATDLPLLTRNSVGNIMVKSNISTVVKF